MLPIQTTPKEERNILMWRSFSLTMHTSHKFIHRFSHTDMSSIFPLVLLLEISLNTRSENWSWGIISDSFVSYFRTGNQHSYFRWFIVCKSGHVKFYYSKLISRIVFVELNRKSIYLSFKSM